MILGEIWVVESRAEGAWSILAVPITEVNADILISEYSADLSPRDFRKVLYKRVDPENPPVMQPAITPESEHANV